MPVREMTSEETEQFLTCARVGRLGLSLNHEPYVVPVGYAYGEGKVFFHTCCKGLKMEALRQSVHVCFEVDETLSDSSMYKSVIMFGTAKIIDDKEEMIPYLQKLIDKYRVPLAFNDYMDKPSKNKEKELAAVRICMITPTKVTSRSYSPKESSETDFRK
jgi:hypothetical protein